MSSGSFDSHARRYPSTQLHRVTHATVIRPLDLLRTSASQTGGKIFGLLVEFVVRPFDVHT
jgi:hypothetical protein